MLEKIANPGSVTLTSIIKNGPGTWDLAAASNTYTGTTTINQGMPWKWTPITRSGAPTAGGSIGHHQRSRTAAG